MQTGNAGPFIAQACDQALSSPTAPMDWASVLPGNSGLVSGLLTGAVDGDPVTITSSDQFEGADNTALAWSGSSWLPAGFVTGDTTFGGHFASETTPTGPAPEPVLGDSLLGIIAPSGNSTGNTTVTMTFGDQLTYVEFQVSSREGANGVEGSDTDFTADLVAMDGQGNIIGTYQVVDTGGGGLCPGLANFADPQPCNDAPFVQFYDPEDRIKSVELIVNDTTGAYIDTLEVSPVPEPSSTALFGIGILTLLCVAKRGSFRRRSLLAGSARD